MASTVPKTDIAESYYIINTTDFTLNVVFYCEICLWHDNCYYT